MPRLQVQTGRFPQALRKVLGIPGAISLDLETTILPSFDLVDPTALEMAWPRGENAWAFAGNEGAHAAAQTMLYLQPPPGFLVVVEGFTVNMLASQTNFLSIVPNAAITSAIDQRGANTTWPRDPRHANATTAATNGARPGTLCASGFQAASPAALFRARTLQNGLATPATYEDFRSAHVVSPGWSFVIFGNVNLAVDAVFYFRERSTGPSELLL